MNIIAEVRGQSLAQMAIALTLHNDAVTTCLIGASRPSQIEDSVLALNNVEFSAEDISKIDAIIR